jgi:low affinity Fe/Cu permease
MYSVLLSLVLAVIGIVVWIEGGPHPRTWGAWMLLVMILAVAALPALLC